jgi:hypothetical protein
MGLIFQDECSPHPNPPLKGEGTNLRCGSLPLLGEEVGMRSASTCILLTPARPLPKLDREHG